MITSCTTYNRYHTAFILAFKENKLPIFIQKQIPRSTRQYWKNTDFKNYFSSPKNKIEDEFFDILKVMWENKRLRQISKALYKITWTYHSIIKTLKHKKALFVKHKDRFIHTIENIKNHFSLKKVISFFPISLQQFNHWKRDFYKCKNSLIKKCLRGYPNQLTQKETETIKYYLEHDDYQTLPSNSVYYQAMRDNKIRISLGTWYSYARLLKLSRKNRFRNPNKYTEGIRAKKPKEIIHMDVTVFKTKDHVRSYIYLIVDNFSRFILGWEIDKKCKAEVSFKNLGNAFKKHLKVFSSTTELIVDGGSENKGEVSEFVDKADVNIQKLVAGIDIRFSNSLIEAANKKLKYHYLFPKNLPDYESVKTYLEKAIPQYNDTPNHVHYGLTPREVFNDEVPDKDKYKDDIKEAMKNRINENKKAVCEME